MGKKKRLGLQTKKEFKKSLRRLKASSELTPINESPEEESLIRMNDQNPPTPSTSARALIQNNVQVSSEIGSICHVQIDFQIMNSTPSSSQRVAVSRAAINQIAVSNPSNPIIVHTPQAIQDAAPIVEEADDATAAACSSSSVVACRSREKVVLAQGMSKMYKIRNDRDELSKNLEQLVIAQNLPSSHGHLKCPFFTTGCRAMFLNEDNLYRHLHNCFFGVFQLCKMISCDTRTGEIFRPIHKFAAHFNASTHHCPAVAVSLFDGVELKFNHGFWNIAPDGYKLVMLRRLKKLIGKQKFGVIIGIVIQNVGTGNHRVIFAPMNYDADGARTDHVVNVECTIVGRDGAPILPISYPDYDEQNVLPTSTSRAFNSIKEFIVASEQVDGVVSYSSKDLVNNSYITRTDEGVLETVKINLKLSVYRCTVKEKAEYPIVQFASTWSHLNLDPRVRAIMTDSSLSRPSYISSILIAQLKGQADVMIESIDVQGVDNCIKAAVFDHILVNFGVRPRNPPRSTVAWIIYPTASMLRQFIGQWKRIAHALELSVFTLNNYMDEICEQLKRVGCDVLVTIPTILKKAFEETEDAAFKDLLTRNVKFVFFASHFKNCFPDQRKTLNFCTDQLNKDRASIIRVGHVECWDEQMKSHSGGNTSEEYQEGVTDIFMRPWNFLSLGPDPNDFAGGLKVVEVEFSSFKDRQYKTNGLVGRCGEKRWLILGMNGRGEYSTTLLEDLAKSMDSYLKDTSRVKCLTKEKEVIKNSCLWDPYLARPDAILIGPYFLLDCPESHFCDAIILLTQPVYDAEIVRIRFNAELPDNQQKPVYLFTRQSVTTQPSSD